MRALLASLLFLFGWIGPLAADCEEMYAAIGAPRYRGDVPSHVVLCRSGYVLAHNQEHLTPDWVIERLTPNRFQGPGNREEEGNPFAPDPTLVQRKLPRAELSDYKGSNYDRGHMAPAASMKFKSEAMRESFYLSNMSPQVGIGLNRGIWADLEALTRTWTCAKGELIVITGPIYDDNPRMIPLPPKEPHVAVPNAFYKIAYDPTQKRVLAFILPNEKIDKKGRSSWEALKGYIVSVSLVEERTGLDFFTSLSRRDQTRIEKIKAAMWPARGECPKS